MSQIEIILPDGSKINVQDNSCPYDVALSISEGLARNAIAAKINGKLCSLKDKLNNGDTLEILTDKSQIPSREWEGLVMTPKAKAQIKRFLKIQDKEKLTQRGKAEVLSLCAEKNKKPDEEDFKKLLPVFNYKTVSDLFCAVGANILQAEEVFFRLYPQYKKRLFGFFSRKGDEKQFIRGATKGKQIQFAACCHPIPGDKIVGILTNNKTLVIHHQECAELDKFVAEPKRFVPLDWDLDKIRPSELPARLKLNVKDAPETFNLILNKVTESHATILQLSILERAQKKATVQLDVEVKNKTHLEKLIDALKKEKGINSVFRKKIE